VKQNRRITIPSLHLVTSGTFRWVTTLIRIQEKYIISGWIWVMVRLLVNWVHFHFSVTYMNAQKFCKNCILSLNFRECGHLHCTGLLTLCIYFVISPTLANTWISFFKNSLIIFMFCECVQMIQDETLLRSYLKLGMWKNHKKTTQARTVDIPALLLCERGHHFTEFLWESTFSWLKISLAKDLISFDECAPLKFSKLKIEFLVLF